jgi:hypothetical protein
MAHIPGAREIPDPAAEAARLAEARKPQPRTRHVTIAAGKACDFTWDEEFEITVDRGGHPRQRLALSEREYVALRSLILSGEHETQFDDGPAL